jgi:Alr-MurF fusion protein
MPLLNIKEAASLTGGNVRGNNELSFNRLATDSRTVYMSQQLMFVAINGERHDGHRFVTELYQKRNVRLFLVSEWFSEWSDLNEAAFLIVDDTLKALQTLASANRMKFSSPVLAITGSNGKTVIKEWLFQLMEDRRIIRSPKSYNSQIGVPLSLWLLEPEADLAIIEAGISLPGEMQHLQQMIQPTEGIFTNIGTAHQENFKDLQQKVREKLQLFRECDRLFYCSDHTLIDNEIKAMPADAKPKSLFCWGHSDNADLQVKEIIRQKAVSEIKTSYKGNSFSFSIPFIDEASVENALHACLYMLVSGYNTDVIASRMKTLSPVAMRLEMKKGVQNCSLINDSYNSDLHSLEIALDLLAGQQQHEKKTLILSDILQTGRYEKELYAEVAEMVKSRGVNKIIGIGQSLMHQAALFGPDIRTFADTAAFLEALPGMDFRNEAILLKGARPFGFERILAQLELRTHRTVLEINLNAMVHNLNFYRSKLKPDTKIMIMVKAFSYGSGSYEIARMLEYQKVDYLAVAIADEGVTLRQAGITTPIAVMNPEEGSHELMIEHRLEPEIYSYRTLNAFSKALAQSKTTDYPIHLKLDTGMHRLGFMEDQLDELIPHLKSNPYVRVQSVFSHLATADDPDQAGFVHEQIDCYRRMSKKIIEGIGYPVIRHLLNSPGIERFAEAQMEMVRLGIGLYGVSCYNQDKLQNISTLKSTISQIKTVPAGETVGYGRKGKTNGHDKVIGVIPIGYADGLNRRFGNGGTSFVVNGKEAPTIGNICMDLCMIDLTGIENVHEGDEVQIFGPQMPAAKLADSIGTIPYEIFTSVSPRVKRVYFEE